MRSPFAHAVRAALTPACCLLISSTFAAAAALAATASPPRSVAEAQNTFALELYRRLATNRDANVFFSPYSLYTALAIVAEGARGETARDMGRMLALPSSLGQDDPARPWNLAPLHAALADQRRAFAGGDRSTPGERAEFDSLRARFARSDALALALRRRGDWEGALAAHETTAVLAAQVNDMARRMRPGELSFCDALWTDSTCSPHPDWVAAVTPAYGEVLRQARFASDPEGARRDINAWVESRTLGRIAELLASGDVSPLTTLVVTDAIAFRGDWQEEFDPHHTRPAVFRLAGGDSLRAPLMGRQGHMRYGAFRADGSRFATPAMRNDEEPYDESKFYPGPGGFELVELPYKGSPLAMVVLLPRQPDGIGRLESLLTPAALERWIEGSGPRRTDLDLPRFGFERGGDIAQELGTMGLARAGDPERAELDGLVRCPAAGARQSVGRVVHRASIEVNEQGTIAVAATAIMVRAGGASPAKRSPFIPYVRADRPFLFLVRNRESGAIVFMGRCAMP